MENSPKTLMSAAFATTTLIPSTNPNPFATALTVKSRPPTLSRKAPYASITTQRTVRTHEDPHHIEHLAHTVASAFENDPVMTHIHGAHERFVYDKQLQLGKALLRAELLRPKGQSTIHVADDGASIAVWHHVGHWKAGGMYLLRLLIGALRCFGLLGFLKFAATMQAVEEAHPSHPHMHLFIIGTHSDYQGKGYGSTVISEMLRHCDEHQLAAYLESSNERNLTFYRRHGFKVLHEIEGLPSDFPQMYALWRDPKPLEEDVKQ
eukprot:TRINITY_DN1074_c0_g1_i1.p1 TRINITY_DN1074_c0_g1~~TRINITY_DN1074_c0_g1_i1.p1  ORF type:complete len:264 (+),score=39.43 TRINITY_DN1074_c0_g1_i1:67-858(+)